MYVKYVNGGLYKLEIYWIFVNLVVIMGWKLNCCGLLWFVNDGIGIGCVVFIYLFIVYVEFVVVFVMLLFEVVILVVIGVFYVIVFILLVGFVFVVYSWVMCSDLVSFCGCSFIVFLVFSLCVLLSFIGMIVCLF